MNKVNVIKQNLEFIGKTWIKCIGTFASILSLFFLFWTWDDIRITSTQYKCVIIILLCVLALILAILWTCIFKRTKTIWESPSGKIKVCYSDIMKDGFDKRNKEEKLFVIPVNSCFDTIVDEDISTCSKPLVSPNSLHGRWIKTMVNSQLIIVYDKYNEYYERTHTVSDIAKKMESQGNQYLKRMNDLQFREKSKKQKLISEIQNLEEKIAKIDGYSLKELIAEFGEDFLPEGISKYGILKFLLINGYINEGYVDYINYFHPNSITKDENDYLRSIRMRNKAKNFAFEIKNLQQVSDRIYDAEYRQTETLNYILTDFMLIQCSEKTNKKYYFDGFELDKGMEHYQFTKEYIERDQNVNDFVSELCKYYRHMWKNIAEDVSLLEETKYKYLSLILNNATMDQIVILDEVEHSDCIKNFIVEDEKSLA